MRLLVVALISVFIGIKSYADQPAPLVLHGSIMDMKTHVPVNAEVDIFHNSDFTMNYSGKAQQGEFSAPLADFGWYIISISAPGYIESTDTLWVTNEKRTNITRKFYMRPIEVGLTVAIQNIYFHFGKTTLDEQSFEELNKVAEFFKENPGVTFEIAGHTDSDGPEDYNMILSQGRAMAVVDYLIGRGVENMQLTAHGYGESKPIDNSETKAGKSRNRRVEFIVLKIAPSPEHK